MKLPYISFGSLDVIERAEEGDVGNVFRYADSFLACYLELFGKQFETWLQAGIQECWRVTDGTG